MNKLSLTLSALLMLAMVVIMAPNVFALNRGHLLRNIAVWLAIFVCLGLIYQNLGPGSPHPLFQLPATMTRPNLATIPGAAPSSSGDQAGSGKDNSFTPPRE